MKNSVKMLLVGVIASLLLVSCGGATPTPTATPIPSPTPKPTEAPTATPEPTAEPTPEEENAVLEASTAYFGEGFKLITAEAVYENLNDGDEANDPYIISICKPEDYEKGHLPGAVNISGGELFKPETLEELPTDKQIVVYCYTGQTAGQATAALNLLGYDAYSLKFGVASWAIREGSTRWNDDMSMGYEASTEPVEASGSHDLPDPMAEDVAAAAEAYFGEGFKLITAEAIYENLNDGDEANDPFLIDIRKAEDYQAGHVPGAVNVSGGELFKPETLAMIPPDAQVVVYCYTGQTAGQATAALNLLGYDAYSMKFGMPAWTIIEGAKRWSDDMSMGYPLEGAGKAVLDAATPYFSEGFKLITAEAVYENLNDGDEANDPLIIDIRKAEDYDVGHLPGAVNLSGEALFQSETLAALPTDKQIVVYCYTGQTAGQVTSALNLLGYDAYSLKFGMPSWAIAEGASRWSDDMSMGYEVETEANELSGSYELPEPMAASATAAAQAYFSEGYKLITAEAVYENLNDGDDANNPFIISICKPEDYEAGHVPGAVNISGGELFKPETLAMIPPEAQVVVYCYTGQTAGQTVSVLNMLGYDAYSLKFGLPAWAITEGASRWSDDMSMGYEMDTEAHELPGAEPSEAGAGGEFALLAEHITARFAEWKPVMSADALYENLNDGDEANDPFILSVRSREHYEIGHVPGAYNIPWREIANPDNLSYLPKDEQILVYCYTGHTGQVAATVLNILGYDVTNLKFGMMGWTDDAEVLATDPFAGAAGYPVETEANELTETYETPMLETGESDAASIAQARAQAMLGDWKPVMSADALYENLNDGDEANDPFILSVRSGEHYEIGHVSGAYNVPWREIAQADNLASLTTETPIVDYCYTGHTGQVAATALGLLGYDVTNLKFGMMSWTDDAEVLATDPFAGAAGYPVETEVHELQ